MMNHHLPAMSHGQLPIPAPRSQQDVPYMNGPLSMRSPPAYMGYPPQMNGHPPAAYPPQQYPQWYAPYSQMQMPPRPHFNPYATPFISSYPHQQQPLMAPAHMPPHSLPLQPRSTTPFHNPMSPSVAPALAPVPPPSQSPVVHPVHSTPSPATTSSPGPMPVNDASPPKEPFRPPLPWLSIPERPFPARAPRRHRKGRSLQDSSLPVQLPYKDSPWNQDRGAGRGRDQAAGSSAPAQAPSEPNTPTVSGAPSLTDSAQPTTPSSTAQGSTARPHSQAKGSKSAVPVVPIVPVKSAPNTPGRGTTADASGPSESLESTPGAASTAGDASSDSAAQSDGTTEAKPVEAAKPSAPKSWADLLKSRNLARSASSQGATAANVIGGALERQSVADVITYLGGELSQYNDKVTFFEPRGLVNTGNMCYMNSVLQVLVFCVPFYQFLDHIGKRASHSFQSDFPMIDALIMFMKEFRVIDAADNEQQLRMRLKANEIEEYGDAFVPEFVYALIRQLPRFRDMRRGHQQDAQEFLGFLLEEMHEECARANSANPAANTASSESEGDDGWMEVGHKQQAAVTQSSGHNSTQSPITKIFGGQIRSEFRVPGNKPSVTFEPYQQLQLDIDAPDVNNIVDALKHLAKSESIHGVSTSSGRPDVTATKQVFIESLPQVLILHLKRFRYDSVTHGTQKIWKKVGYPLDLEVPREVFPPHRVNAMRAHGGLPKYRLISVIYHHGKNASGGHYTVDVRRQEGREWMRFDDTLIRRIENEDKEPANVDDHLSQADQSDVPYLLFYQRIP